MLLNRLSRRRCFLAAAAAFLLGNRPAFYRLALCFGTALRGSGCRFCFGFDFFTGRAFIFQAGIICLARRFTAFFTDRTAADQHQINLAGIQIGTRYFYCYPFAHAEAYTAALALNRHDFRQIVEVVLTQIADVYQTFDINIVQGHKQAEIGHAGNLAAEYFTDFILHIVGFQPVFHVAAGIIGAPFGKRSMRTRLRP